MVRLAIVGSRNVNDYDFVSQFINEVLVKENFSYDNIIIISGGARGIDTLAEEFAKKNSIPYLIFPANWNKYGKKAGSIRNSKIIEHSDIVIAIPNDNSIGTWDTVNKAKKKGLKIYLKKYTS